LLSDINDSVAITDPYAAVKFYHDWIAANTIYTLDTNYNNAEGVFQYGQSACLGYSLAFESLMDEWSELHPEAGCRM
jgi:transglutaminase-like putative cysteine protease